jgi:hypothetical protein
MNKKANRYSCRSFRHGGLMPSNNMEDYQPAEKS